MKLLIQNNRIAGTATDAYMGPDEFITAPVDFDIERMGEYQLIEGVLTVPPVDVLALYVTAITNHLDSVAQTKYYDNRITCSVRAAYPGPYQAEGISFGTWMDTCNAAGYQILADYQAGLIPQPTIEELIAGLPEMVWPGNG